MNAMDNSHRLSCDRQRTILKHRIVSVRLSEWVYASIVAALPSCEAPPDLDPAEDASGASRAHSDAETTHLVPGGEPAGIELKPQQPNASTEFPVVACGGYEPPLAVELHASTGAKAVAFTLTNNFEEPAEVDLRLEILAGTVHVFEPIAGDVALDGNGTKPITFPVGTILSKLSNDDVRFSGQFLVHASLANGEKAIHGPFYFHPTDSSNLAASGLAVYDEAAYKGEFNKGNYEAAVDLPPDDGHRLGIIYVGQGLSPEVVAEIEANDPS